MKNCRIAFSTSFLIMDIFGTKLRAADGRSFHRQNFVLALARYLGAHVNEVKLTIEGLAFLKYSGA